MYRNVPRSLSRSAPPATRLHLAAAVGVVCLLAGGCSPGVRWRGFVFDSVLAEAQRDNKLTFVYFRNWMTPACTRFEEDVLKAPEVLAALDGLYCVVVDFYQDRPLADKWDIEAPPAVVLVDTNQKVLGSVAGEIAPVDLLAAIDTAKRRFAAKITPIPTE